MRALNTAGQALMARALAGEQIPVVQLVELELDVVWRLTSAGIPLEWAGQTWQPVGGTVTGVEDDVGEFLGITLTLPAVTPEQLAVALVEDVEGRTVRIYDAWVDPDTGAVADAALAWSGALEIPAIEDGPTATLAISAEHRGAIALRPKPSRYTDSEQRRLYPGDTSLNFDPATDAKPLAWPAASFFRQE